MSVFKIRSAVFRKNYSYKLLPLSCYILRSVKIIDLGADKISFFDIKGNQYFILAEFIPFWGYDIYAEVLCDLYGGSGLFINNSRGKDYYEEAKSYLKDSDIINFCNMHKTRWRKLTFLDCTVSG